MTQQLTAEKARERLEQLKQAEQRCGLSLNEKLLQQALELALLVLTGETLREGADGHVWSEMSEEDYQQHKDEWFTRTVIVLEKTE